MDLVQRCCNHIVVEICALLVLHVPPDINQIITQYHHDNDLLFTVGQSETNNLHPLKTIYINNLNNLIIIMMGAAHKHHHTIKLIIKSFHTSPDKHQIQKYFQENFNIWIKIFSIAFDNGNCQFAKDVNEFTTNYQISHHIDLQVSELLNLKINLMESTNGQIPTTGFIHLIDHFALYEHILTILNLAFKYSHSDTIRGLAKLFIRCNHKKHHLINIIKKAPPIKEYTSFLFEIESDFNDDFFDTIYTTSFSDVSFNTHQINHTYALPFIKLISNTLLINELYKHERKRKRLKNGLNHIIIYLKNEQNRRNALYKMNGMEEACNYTLLKHHHTRSTRRRQPKPQLQPSPSFHFDSHKLK